MAQGSKLKSKGKMRGANKTKCMSKVRKQMQKKLTSKKGAIQRAKSKGRTSYKKQMRQAMDKQRTKAIHKKNQDDVVARAMSAGMKLHLTDMMKSGQKLLDTRDKARQKKELLRKKRFDAELAIEIELQKKARRANANK